MITAQRSPWLRLVKTCSSSVVFPAPRKPESIVTGSRSVNLGAAESSEVAGLADLGLLASEVSEALDPERVAIELVYRGGGEVEALQPRHERHRGRLRQPRRSSIWVFVRSRPLLRIPRNLCGQPLRLRALRTAITLTHRPSRKAEALQTRQTSRGRKTTDDSTASER